MKVDPKLGIAYVKRSRVRLSRSQFAAAVKDLDRALELEPSSLQARLQRGAILRKICRYDSAKADVETLLQRKPGHKTATGELDAIGKGKQALNTVRTVFATSKASPNLEYFIKQALEYAPECVEVHAMQAELRLDARDFESAVQSAGRILKVEPGNIPALTLRGRAQYQLGELESALKHFREALKFDPEHKEVKAHYNRAKKLSKFKKKAEEAFATHKFKEAIDHYETAIAADPEHPLAAAMSGNLGQAYFKTRKPKKAVQACNRALQHDPNNAEAMFTRAEARIAEGEYEGAFQDAKTLHAKQPGDMRYRELYSRAQNALQKSKMKDHYKTLGVDRAASDLDIKKAYRRLAKLYHPDKVQGDEAKKEEAGKKFQEVADSYEILSDPEKKARYDRGEDVNGQMQGHPGHGNPFHHGGGFHGHRGHHGGQQRRGNQHFTFHFG